MISEINYDVIGIMKDRSIQSKTYSTVTAASMNDVPTVIPLFLCVFIAFFFMNHMV
jgi:hypothetical protein